MEEAHSNSMTACERFNSELADHLEGNAQPFVHAHTGECPTCSSVLADLELIRLAARDLPLEDPSAKVWTLLRKSLAPDFVTSQQIADAACARFSVEIEGYLEGGTPPFVVSHAQECAPCNSLLADLQAIQVAARDLPLADPAPSVWAKISEELQAQGDLVLSPCVQFAAGLEGYLEGEAHPIVALHAAKCANCNSLLSELQAIQVAAQDLPQPEPSPAMWSKISKTLAREGILIPAACEHFSTELEGYLEGEALPSVVSHVRECAPCGAMRADMESIRESACTLPQEEPSRAVWANIRARLESDGAFAQPESGWSRFLRFLPQPAPLGILAAVVIFATVLSLPSHPSSPGNASQEAKSDLTNTQLATLMPPAEDMPVAHVVSDLESNFKANEASMTPDVKATYEKSLVSLDSSISECLDSLHQEPGNTLAHDYLLTAYTRKAEVLSSALEFEGR